MNMPGFTAEAAVFSSQRQYRRSPSSWGPVTGVVPQLQNGTCMDWECLFWRQEHSPYPETCYDTCQRPCDPMAPPETLPPPGRA